jgi:hypothetical protein
MVTAGHTVFRDIPADEACTGSGGFGKDVDAVPARMSGDRRRGHL